MPHTKFLGNRFIGSGGKDLKVLTIYGCGGKLKCDQDHLNKCSFQKLLEAEYEIWSKSQK